MSRKGFEAKVIVRHCCLNIGDEVYIKATGFDFYGHPILFSILNRKTGVAIGSLDANELRNKFEIQGE